MPQDKNLITMDEEASNAQRTPEEIKAQADDDEILSEARQRCDDDEDQIGYILTELEQNQRFFSGGEQWDPMIKESRDKNEGGPRPVLTFNKCSTYINRLCNDQRMNRPGFNLKPKNDGADPKDAEIAEGLVRDIVNNADSASAYDTAMDNAANCGLGYYWVKTRYCDDDSFDQEIYLDRVFDSRTVIYPIQQSKRIDFSDCNHCFIVEDTDKEEYKKEHPDFVRADIGDWTSQLGSPWIKDKMIRRAYYFRKVKKPDKLCLLEGGQRVFLSDIPAAVLPTVKIVNKRKVDKTTVEWYLMVAYKILERGTLAGERLPIIPCVGKEVCYDGKRYFRPVAWEAKDAQKMLNYTKSAFAEWCALAPKSQWMIAEGQDEGYQHEYKAANQANIISLHYKPTTFETQLVPPPQRVQPQALNVALVEEMRAADDDIKTIIGLPDVNMGRSKNERSGKAIKANQAEGELINYHFPDNLRKSMMAGWQVICGMLPTIYDMPRTVKITGINMEDQSVKINQEYTDQYGQTRRHDLTKLKFEVVADTGPSYRTRREQTADFLLELIEHLPEAGPGLIDLIAKAIGAEEEVVDRCKMLLPPNLQQKPEMKDVPVPVQQLVQKLEQGMQKARVVATQKDQIIAQLIAAVNDKSAERDLKLKTVLIKAQTELKRALMDQAHEVGLKAHDKAMEFAVSRLPVMPAQPEQNTAPAQQAGDNIAAPAQQQGV
jgi:Phage P22-like portal protein